MNETTFLSKTKEIIKCKKSCDGTHCYWDRHPITNDNVFRCPIQYVPSENKRVHVTRGGSSYVIKEKITKKDREKKIVPSDTVTVQKEYYETEGVFCSLECCVAYVRSNAHDSTYEDSYQLLMKMYNIIKLPNAAPHWRVLVDYGGWLSIGDYRKQLNTTRVAYHGTFVSICNLYEDGKKFN